MLVLTRKVAEKLYIGNEICVTVVRLDGGQVRLGIEAPREVPVVRAELLRRDATAASSFAVEAIDGLEPLPSRPRPATEAARPADPIVPAPAVRVLRPAPLEIGSRRRGPSR